MTRIIIIIMLFLAIADNTIKSQELLAKVTINHNQIQGTDASVSTTYSKRLNNSLTTGNGQHSNFRKTNALFATSTSP